MYAIRRAIYRTIIFYISKGMKQEGTSGGTRHVYVTCNIEISMNWIDLYIYIRMGEWVVGINLVCDISNYLPQQMINGMLFFFLYLFIRLS